MNPTILALALSLVAATAQAAPPESAPRPSPRLALADPDAAGAFLDRVRAMRPRPRAAAQGDAPSLDPAKDTAFRAWTRGFRDRALAHGISRTVIDRAFDGVTYDPEVIRRDSNQSEFTKTIWEYLDSAASDTRIANGRAALARHAATFDAIEARYGVEKEIVAAVWGLESAYGTFKGKSDIVRSLATLAFDGRRGAFFEEQLIAALRILQAGDTDARHMTGSWAGAMGHTQFIPSSYLDYAVDFDGDGRRHIWGDDPTDALASTAAYLSRFGWQKGQPWGVEVRVPSNFDYAQAQRTVTRLPSEWARFGVTGIDGAVPDHGPASVLLPAGADGAAFLVFNNFAVIERYNTADAYVIGVGHLADRLKGVRPIRGAWPRGDRALTRAEREELQSRLTATGFDTQKIDGRIGPLTIEAIRGFQRRQGLVPDGYASLRLLEAMRTDARGG
ncbi:lytic murein transglycosylase [Oceaniovalibus guishaninsula JLT2003]|uniref:Lytic murein transglycosylase n=1 Tax=Oceaniovalibus guishaninsula JLT2003 TaxID=1231392 RepID=K2GQR1_9RHOB|nr:lytic murein transglycosylase [Oceaniovalibus guishaninsula]EKE44981.1 lytic murein transglycosylase [Oceaniovalibus guishaninsula JLT2003]